MAIVGQPMLQDEAAVDTVRQALLIEIDGLQRQQQVKESATAELDERLIADLRAELRRVTNEAKARRATCDVAVRHSQLAQVQRREAEQRSVLQETAWRVNVEHALTAERLRAGFLVFKQRQSKDEATQTPADATARAIAAGVDKIAFLERLLHRERIASMNGSLNVIDDWRARAQELSKENSGLRLALDAANTRVALADGIWNGLIAVRDRFTVDAACGDDSSTALMPTSESQTLDSRSNDAMEGTPAEDLRERLRNAESLIAALTHRALSASTAQMCQFEEAFSAQYALSAGNAARHSALLAESKAAAAALRLEVNMLSTDIIRLKGITSTLETQRDRLAAEAHEMSSQLTCVANEKQVQESTLASTRRELAAKSEQLTQAQERIAGMEYLVKTRDRVATGTVHAQLLDQLASERLDAAQAERVLRRVLTTLNGSQQQPLSDAPLEHDATSGQLLKRARRILELVERASK